MESYLNENFGDVKAKNSSEEALQRWRKLCRLVKNRKHRFRFTANLSKAIYRSNQEKFRIAISVSKAALEFLQDINLFTKYTVPEEVEVAGFQIDPDELGSIVEDHNIKKFKAHGGAEGIAEKLSTSITNGISSSEDSLNQRKRIFGTNIFTQSPKRGYWTFVREAFYDMSLIILAFNALGSLVVDKVFKGWSKSAHDVLGILASILIFVFVNATRNYKQSLLFKDLDKEKQKIITVQVTRHGFRQEISKCDLLPGDVVHLYPGAQVPADGVFLSGFSLLINESSLTGNSEPVNVNILNPFLLSGTKVQDGSCKMLVTTVGRRTQWGKLMATLSEEGDDETPLQVKLNRVANIIWIIGLCFTAVTKAVVVQGLISHMLQEGTMWTLSGDVVKEILEVLAVAVTIVVLAIPGGLAMALTLSLAFAMKKMLKDKGIVRHLAACETMGSATCICSDKTGTLTSNQTVVKACICEEIIELRNSNGCSDFESSIPASALRILLQSIFNNTGREVVKSEGNKTKTFGSPTETAILEFGLRLGGDFEAAREASKIVKVEPFNSTTKRTGVVLELPEGGFRAHCKGGSETILAACDKLINSNGEVVPLTEASTNHLKDTIEQFAGEALQTLCLAYMDIGNQFSAEDSIPVKGYTCIGIVGIKNPVRPGIKESVAFCRLAGINVRMVTGDNINTAKVIARECGILTDNGTAIEAPEFREKSDEELFELIPKIQVMAQSSPLDKHSLVKHMRTTFKEVVVVTGDGTSDAPQVREADIRLAMGIAGTEIAKESADVIMLDDNFSTIVTMVKWGRSVYTNIQKFVQFHLTVAVVTSVINFSSACLTVWDTISRSAALATVQHLWVEMIMDTLGALALVTQPPNDDLMKRPLVGRKGNFITNVMWRNILGQSLFQFLVLWYLQRNRKAIFHLDGPDSDLILSTLSFNTFVFFQVFNKISSRDMEKINVFKGLLKNYVFVAVLICTVFFQIVIVEFIGTFATTTPLTWQQWFVSILFGFLGMPIAAALKLIPVGQD